MSEKLTMEAKIPCSSLEDKLTLDPRNSGHPGLIQTTSFRPGLAVS